MVPVEPMESMLRPFKLVIPFTVQKGELTGTAPGRRGTRAPGRTPSSLVFEMQTGARRAEVSSPRSCSKLGRAGTQTEAFCLPVQVHPTALGWC